MNISELKPSIEPIRYDNGILFILDQRELPHNEVWLEIRSLDPLLDAIRGLAVRGAPLLGIAAGYGVLIGLINEIDEIAVDLPQKYARIRKAIASTRPTARNLFGTLERMDYVSDKNAESGRKILLKEIESETRKIHTEERDCCLAIAENGLNLFKSYKRIITHCNTGALATGGIGTALGVITAAHAEYGLVKIIVDETRPLLQGARLTSWELDRLGIPYVLICDNSAASLMQNGMIDAAITGADRIASNGDAANKIGTLNLAILCDYFDVPFYIASPTSTFDPSISGGEDIEIEQRSRAEIHGWRDCLWSPVDAPTLNPAFDVTPAKFITSIITESGVIERPDAKNIRAHLFGEY